MEKDTIKSWDQTEENGAPEGNRNAAGPHKKKGGYPKDPAKYKERCGEKSSDPIAPWRHPKTPKGTAALNGVPLNDATVFQKDMNRVVHGSNGYIITVAEP